MANEVVDGIIFDWIGTLYERDKGAFEWSARVLEALRGDYKLGLVSLAREDIERRRDEIDASGISHYFDSIIVDSNKNPAQYLKCMGEMKTLPSRIAIVDDRMKRGIKIGNLLGCRTYWIQQGEYAHELPDDETGEPTQRINSIEDLLRIL